MQVKNIKELVLQDYKAELQKYEESLEKFEVVIKALNQYKGKVINKKFYEESGFIKTYNEGERQYRVYDIKKSEYVASFKMQIGAIEVPIWNKKTSDVIFNVTTEKGVIETRLVVIKEAIEYINALDIQKVAEELKKLRKECKYSAIWQNLVESYEIKYDI